MLPELALWDLAIIPISSVCVIWRVLALWCLSVASVLAFVMFLAVLICRRERTPFGRLVAAIRIVAFRFSLEAIAWAAGLLLFTVVSLLFFRANSFRLLLPPFLLSMYALRAYAWWVVGGKGFPSLNCYLHTTGLELRSKPLIVWTTLGLLLSVTFDVGFFLTTGMSTDLLRLWDRPYG